MFEEFHDEIISQYGTCISPFVYFMILRYAHWMNETERKKLVDVAETNLRNIVTVAIEKKADEQALVVYDTQYGLTSILTDAYRRVLPDARFVDFGTTPKDQIIALFDEMKERDLVVLLQSSNFLLDAFRIRLHLFQKKLKVIEHVHLHRNSEQVWDVYINALAYDPAWYRSIGPKLRQKLEKCDILRIEGKDAVLTVTGGLEPPKPNLGDYAGMENIGGTFPIGEVFTESVDFSKMNGSFFVYAYAGADFCVDMHEPFRVDVKEGVVTTWQADAPKSFIEIVEMIKEYERPLIREIGFGLNRAITRERYLEDITAFERILGLHLSMGEKHSVYKKEGITTHKTKFHVDLFPFVERVYADGELIFNDGEYVI
jgi:hypothetical protein